VTPLSSLQNGERAQISYLSPGNRPELHKFIAMGLVPGADVRIAQTSPALVVEIGDTLLAMDADLARNIYVRKTSTS
jgi:DtxR family Mn-dependent transcriptional regulator